MKMGYLFVVLSLWVAGAMASLAPATFGFEDPIKQQQFSALVKEIRCVTCPNQSIGDSQAPIAIAMKEDIYRRLEEGESEQAIRDYLLSHYGEYVSFRPPVQKETWALWGGPFAMLLLGGAIWSTFFYRRQRPV